jgi:putative acetyltransferase
MPTAAIDILPADFSDDRVVGLLRTHAETARAQTAEGCAHALDVDALKRPDLSVWAAWRGDELVGVGALRRLSAEQGELKAMHTKASARGAGVGRAMLDHLLRLARGQGLRRVSLETGSWPYFQAARAMYATAGFLECGPFGDYREGPNSVYMTLVLDEAAEPTKR